MGKCSVSCLIVRGYTSVCCQGNTHPCAYMHYISRDIHVYVYRYIYIHTKVYINMLAYTVYTYHTGLSHICIKIHVYRHTITLEQCGKYKCDSHVCI